MDPKLPWTGKPSKITEKHIRAICEALELPYPPPFPEIPRADRRSDLDELRKLVDRVLPLAPPEPPAPPPDLDELCAGLEAKIEQVVRALLAAPSRTPPSKV